MSYDAFGNRVEEDVTSGGQTSVMKFAYDQAGNIWADLGSNGSVQVWYLYLDGQTAPAARLVAGGSASWYVTDRLGSVVALTDATGALVDTIRYDAYGKVLSEGNPAVGSRYKAFGYQYDAALGMYYDLARWYDENSGRFMQQDPLGFQAGDSNKSRYVGNDPTNANDPTGLSMFGDFMRGVGNGAVELPLMFWDAGNAVYSAAYMDITGKERIPRYRSMTAQAADRASQEGGREAVASMMKEAYKDLATAGVRPAYRAAKAAVNGDLGPAGQIVGGALTGRALARVTAPASTPRFSMMQRPLPQGGRGAVPVTVPANGGRPITPGTGSEPIIRPGLNSPVPGPPGARIVPGGGLAAHEAADGHTIARHIGKTDAELAARLAAERRISGASSFPVRAIAERATAEALHARASDVSNWLAGTQARLVLDRVPIGYNVGRSLPRGAAAASDVQAVRIVLQRDPAMPTGYRIITSFPTR
jgi:RHS repeat-associated protein